MTATATAPAPVARSRAGSGRVAPRPTPRSVPAVPQARRAPALHVVEPPVRRYPARAVAVAAVVLVFGSMLASAVFHSVLVSGQARIDELERQVTAAEKGLAHDRLELARMSSPERIAEEAERLGLVIAERQTWIRPGSDAEPVVTGGDTATDAGADDGADDGETDSTDSTGSTGTSRSIDGDDTAPTGAEELALGGAQEGQR